jgi:hypothetical protein
VTESEWLAAEHPRRMFEHLGGRVTDRKRRLFAIACARRTTALWGDHRPQDVLAEAERLADNTAAEVNRWGCGSGAARQFTLAAAVSTVAPDPLVAADLSASHAATSLGYAASEPFPYPTRLRVYANTVRQEGTVQAELVRCIFGNPFRPTRLDPMWLTDTVVALARHIYESSDPSATLPLADALQDAGCDNEDVLSHCRGDAPHVRGCWVCDLVLGKE